MRKLGENPHLSNFMLSSEEFDLWEQNVVKVNLVALSFSRIQIYDYNNKDSKHTYIFPSESVNNKYTTVSHVVKSAAIDKRCYIVTKL